MFMIGVCPIYPCFNGLHMVLVSKVTFDIMCETVFGYKADSLHNPENEFKVAYDRIVSLQDSKFIHPGSSIVIEAAYSTECRKIRVGGLHSWLQKATGKFLDV